MSVQVGGQALGPVIAGFMFDYFDSYRIPFTFFRSGGVPGGADGGGGEAAGGSEISQRKD